MHQRLVLFWCWALLRGCARALPLQGAEGSWQQPLGLTDDDYVLKQEPTLELNIAHSPGGFQPASRCSFISNLGKVADGEERAIFMLGDSTMRCVMKGVCDESDHKAGNYTTGQVTWCRIAGLLTVFYGAVEGGNFNHSEQLIAMEAAVGRKAETIVFNGGLLHLLHMIPARPWSLYPLWTNMEAFATQWLDAVAVPGRQLIFMNSNSICEDKYIDEYNQVIKSIRKDAVAAAKPCQQFITREHNVDAAAALEQCRNGFFDREGILRLNQRMEKVLEAWHKTHPDTTIRTLDSFSMTDGKCEYATPGDGRHFVPLSYSHLNELWSMLGWNGPVPEEFAERHFCAAPP